MIAGAYVEDQSLWEVVEDHGADPHVLRILAPAREDWLEIVAAVYRDLRTAAESVLSSVSLDGVEVLSTQALGQRLISASVPVGNHPVRQFAVPRSDLAEVLLLEVMRKDFASEHGYLSLRDRELVELPGRGIDLVGIEILGEALPSDDAVQITSAPEGPTLVLLLGEAKTTTSTTCPPAVVDTNGDCLREQHLHHLADLEATGAKIVEASRRCKDPRVRAAFLVADEMLRARNFDILRVASTSLLLRPAGLGQSGDFGTFQASPEDYAPGVVRFVIFRLDSEDLEAVVDRFIELARAEAPSPGSES